MTEVPSCNLSCGLSCRWLVLAMAMMRFYIQKGTHKGLYRSIARTLKFFQTFALVEVRISRTMFAVTCTTQEATFPPRGKLEHVEEPGSKLKLLSA